MITIVHGSDIVSSRKYFIEQKDKDSLTFDASSLILSELEQSIRGSGLFGQGEKIFIENLFSRKSVKNYEPILSILQNVPAKISVFIWSDKEQGAKSLSSFPNHISELYKINQNIFGFLDSLRPGSSQNLINLHKALKFSEPEIIFFMIIRQFRLMLGLLGDSKQTIDELKRLSPWQRGKLSRQASLFGIENLKKAYKKIYKIEKQVKTGKSALTLVQNIDILMLEI